MPTKRLKRGSDTWMVLVRALRECSVAQVRYSYFSRRAREDGDVETADLFAGLATSHEGLAHGLLDYLKDTGDESVDLPFVHPLGNVDVAARGELSRVNELLPGFARVARDDGHDEVAQWFETMARAERMHSRRLVRQRERAQGQV